MKRHLETIGILSGFLGVCALIIIGMVTSGYIAEGTYSTRWLIIAIPGCLVFIGLIICCLVSMYMGILGRIQKRGKG